MTLNSHALLSISLISTSVLGCRAQLTGLPHPTLHPITSDEAAVPTALPTQTDTDSGLNSDSVPPTEEGPVARPTNEPASEEPSSAEPYEPDAFSDTYTMSTEGHMTAGIGSSHGSFEDNGHTMSRGGSGISVGAIIAIIVAVIAVIAACIVLLVVRRRRQQRTRRAAAGMRQLKLGGSHVRVQTAAISKPMPVQLGVGYSQHYRAQGYEPDDGSSYHSRGSSYDSQDMYSTIRPGMAGIGTHASIHSSQDTMNSRWSP